MHLTSLKLVTRPLPIAILATLSIWGLATEKAFSTTTPWIPPVVNGVTVQPTGTLKTGMTVKISCNFIGMKEEPIDTNTPKGKYIEQQSWWIPVGVYLGGHFIKTTPNKEAGMDSIGATDSSDPVTFTIPKYWPGNHIQFQCIADYNDPMRYFYSNKIVAFPIIPNRAPLAVPHHFILPKFNGSNNSGSSSTQNKSAPTPQAPIMQPNSRRVEPMRR